jgi:hypothetical protein
MWLEHVARMGEKRSAYHILVGNAWWLDERLTASHHKKSVFYKVSQSIGIGSLFGTT